MACCSDKVAFAVSKAHNLKALLAPLCVTEEAKAYLNTYDPSHVQELTVTYLAPLYKTNTLFVARNALKEHLSTPDDSALLTKIDRYLQCFCECLLE
jgi:hypothetical protein